MGQDKQNYLEMIDRPVFVVKDGIICQVNQLAASRQIHVGDPIEPMLEEHAQTYHRFQGEYLYLTLKIGLGDCGASVIRQEDADVFLLDREVEEEQLQILALAGQQLRMPLSNVMIMAETLLPELQEKPETKAFAAQLNKGLFQLLRIVSNMADGAYYQAGKLRNPETTECMRFLSEIVEKAQTMLADSSVRIRYDGLREQVCSVIDRQQTQRAILNLISNAVKFSPAGGCVLIHASVSGKYLQFTVENQGDGINAQIMSSLFQRYQREPAVEDSRHGLGLGLMMIRSVAAAHGGTVLVEQHQGTRVTMTMAIRTDTHTDLRTPAMRIGDYLGGRDSALVELSEILPGSAFETE